MTAWTRPGQGSAHLACQQVHGRGEPVIAEHRIMPNAHERGVRAAPLGQSKSVVTGEIRHFGALLL